ncbi:MAG: c-type cytochrome, partial [Betaproteobacteria bacterium]
RPLDRAPGSPNEETTVMKLMAARLGAAAALAACSLSAIAQAPAAPIEARAGAYLSANCANCHGTQGKSVGAMPSLAGQPKATIVEAMRAFRDGKRPATIMHQLSRGYSDAQIDAIADHLSKLPR